MTLPPMANGGALRVRSHRRFALPFIRFVPDVLTYLVRLFLKRQRDRTPGALHRALGEAHPGARGGARREPAAHAVAPA
jgi:hypothetical protein